MIFYHTQERRTKCLDKPIKCNKDNAWLGQAYYFWENEDDAVFWGVKFKQKTGRYNIYKAEIASEDILDTVFDREHYSFWIKQIERAAKFFVKKTGVKPTLKEINDYFYERKVWTDIDGILFQDISENPIHFMVKEFQYKKRIQLALYNYSKITTFALHYAGDI